LWFVCLFLRFHHEIPGIAEDYRSLGGSLSKSFRISGFLIGRYYFQRSNYQEYLDTSGLYDREIDGWLMNKWFGGFGCSTAPHVGDYHHDRFILFLPGCFVMEGQRVLNIGSNQGKDACCAL
jgi:hypothetical protein